MQYPEKLTWRKKDVFDSFYHFTGKLLPPRIQLLPSLPLPGRSESSFLKDQTTTTVDKSSYDPTSPGTKKATNCQVTFEKELDNRLWGDHPFREVALVTQLTVCQDKPRASWILLQGL